MKNLGFPHFINITFSPIKRQGPNYLKIENLPFLWLFHLIRMFFLNMGKLDKEWEKKGETEEKGGKERKREKGRLGRRACKTVSQLSLGFCLPCPVHLCTKSGPCSNRLRKKSGKNKKKCKFEQTEHWFVTTNGTAPDRSGAFTSQEGHRCSPLS